MLMYKSWLLRTLSSSIQQLCLFMELFRSKWASSDVIVLIRQVILILTPAESSVKRRELPSKCAAVIKGNPQLP